MFQLDLKHWQIIS